jgi:hypothetical protein
VSDPTSPKGCGYRARLYRRLCRTGCDPSRVLDRTKTLSRKRVTIHQQIRRSVATNRSLNVAEAIREQLHKNYQVHEAERLEALKGTERHERVMGKQNLEDALKG